MDSKLWEKEMKSKLETRLNSRDQGMLHVRTRTHTDTGVLSIDAMKIKNEMCAAQELKQEEEPDASLCVFKRETCANQAMKRGEKVANCIH